MLTTASHTHSSTARTQDTPHVFVTPVVRELPRPAPEPLSWASCW
jgi:hypothetical protein